ncbi:spaetzle-processing enzyme-like isoform X2 [Schistocerca gregaria]|uniref:spaetzle-processing enzyme-like isoform X2 n=1 Tax=Schistocerca gregaria TaxID=7010 RepID=UPI00211E5E45|nr:spaetzle-processing enzyme-like isoform X2 [Schistocerca gregaria]
MCHGGEGGAGGVGERAPAGPRAAPVVAPAGARPLRPQRRRPHHRRQERRARRLPVDRSRRIRQYALPARQQIPGPRGLIRLGEHNTRTDPDCEDGVCAEPVQDFRPSEVLMHAEYDQSPFKNDISLIRLDRAVRFHDFVMPICMIHGKLLTKNYVGEPTEVAGWGVFDIEDPRPSPILQTITLRVVSNAECAPRFEMYAEVGPTQMCVGGVVGQDSCGGDSGGPLMKVEALDGPPRYYLLGVVSFGSKRCGASTMPGVYTRMADYVHWVLDNMHE